MKQEEIQQFKVRLEEEKETLTRELENIAVQDPQNPDNWNAKGSDMNERESDPNKLGDNLEQEGMNEAVTDALETQLKDVHDALSRIDAGTYGTCEIGGEEISPERLNANPAARTCVEHMQ